MAPRKSVLEPPRSPKAPRPPEEAAVPPRLRRRAKRAAVLVRKGTTLLQAERGPRTARGAKSPTIKKR
ncbi:MAG: hypothetical protein HYV62_07950 [Candidatus Rokubacteria bacterium]|nr:hypothetical protein [Candidatus Rokubacteria bacterium]